MDKNNKGNMRTKSFYRAFKMKVFETLSSNNRTKVRVGATANENTGKNGEH
jgi:hypothetical protein